MHYANGTPVKIQICASPLDSNNKIRKEQKIYKKDKGLPFHSDLLYNWHPTAGQNAPPEIKKIAKYLCKTPPSLYRVDTNPGNIEWCGEDLNLC